MGKRFKFSATKFDANDYPRLIQEIRNAIEKYDFETDWIAAPADGKVRHDLDAQPRWANVFQSDNADGSDADQILVDCLTSEFIEFTPTKAYVQVFAER